MGAGINDVVIAAVDVGVDETTCVIAGVRVKVTVEVNGNTVDTTADTANVAVIVGTGAEGVLVFVGIGTAVSVTIGVIVKANAGVNIDVAVGVTTAIAIAVAAAFGSGVISKAGVIVNLAINSVINLLMSIDTDIGLTG